MKKAILFCAATVLISMGIISCGGSSKDSPSATLEKAFDYMSSKDFDKVVSLYCSNGELLNEEETKKMLGMFTMSEEQLEEHGGQKGIEILEENIADDGLSAKVKYKIIYKDGTEEDEKAKFSKIDGKWFIEVN